MCDTKCVGHWNLVSEVGLPKPDREVVFTYTKGVNDYRMVDVGAYFTQDLLTESFEKNKEGFFKGQMNKDTPKYNYYNSWFMYVCSPKNVIAWYYLEPYEKE